MRLSYLPRSESGVLMRFRKVYLEIGNICNLQCSFCPGTRREPRMLTLDEFRFLANKIRGYTDYLYFHLMGEPLLHPLLEEFLAEASLMGFKVMITTNGTLLREKGTALLASPAVHKINISLQSFEANSGGVLEDYLTDCIFFVRQAAEKGIYCEFRLWNQGGLESRNREILQILEEAFPLPWEESRNGRRLGERIWLDPGERFDWPDLTIEEFRSSGFCYGLRDQIGVLCDGTVVPCCLDHEGDIALGNLFQQDLDDILGSDRARAIYESFSRRKVLEPLCKRCGFAKRFR